MKLRILILHCVAIEVVAELFFIGRTRSLNRIDLPSGDCLESSSLAQVLVDSLLARLSITFLVATICRADRGMFFNKSRARIGSGLLIGSFLLDAQ